MEVNREVYEITKKVGIDIEAVAKETIAKVMKSYTEKTQTSNKEMTEVMIHSLEKHQLALESHMTQVLEYQDTVAAMALRVLYRQDVLANYARHHRKQVLWRKSFAWWKAYARQRRFEKRAEKAMIQELRRKQLRRLLDHWLRYKFSSLTEKNFMTFTAKCELQVEELIKSNSSSNSF